MKNKTICIFLVILFSAFIFAEDYVIEGVGFKEIKIGKSYSEIIEFLGNPDFTTKNGDKECLWYKDKMGMVIIIQDSKVLSITFESTFIYSFENGAKIGYKIKYIKKLYGDESLINVREGVYRATYKKLGVKFWYNERKRVERFSVFTPVVEDNINNTANNENGNVKEEIKYSNFSIQTIPDKAYIFVDKKLKGRSGDIIRVKEGKHTIGVAKYGYVDIRIRENIEKDNDLFKVKFKRKGRSSLLSYNYKGDWYIWGHGKPYKEAEDCWSIEKKRMLFRAKQDILAEFSWLAYRREWDTSTNRFLVGIKVRTENIKHIDLRFGPSDCWRFTPLQNNKWYTVFVIVDGNEDHFFVNEEEQKTFGTRGGWRDSQFGLLVTLKNINDDRIAEFKDLIFLPLNEKSIKKYIKNPLKNW